MKIPISLAVLAAIATIQASNGQKAPAARKQASEMFQANCIACHQVPDLRYDVDRAWLNQVADTA